MSTSKAGNVRFGILLGVLLALTIIFFQQNLKIEMYIAAGFALALIFLRVFFTLKSIKKKKEYEAYFVRRAEQEKIDLQNRQRLEQEQKNYRAAMLEKIPRVLSSLTISPLKTWNQIAEFMTEENYYSFTDLMYKHESEEYRQKVQLLYETVKSSMFGAEFLDVIQIADTKKQFVFNDGTVKFVRRHLRDLINSIHDDEKLQRLYKQYKNLQEATKGKSDYRGYEVLYRHITAWENADIIEILCINGIIFEQPAKD